MKASDRVIGGAHAPRAFVAGLLAVAGDAGAQTVTVPFADLAAHAIPVSSTTVAALAATLALLGALALRRRLARGLGRLHGGAVGAVLAALIFAAGSSGAWIPRVFALAGATSFDLELPGPTVSPVLAVGVDVAVHNATGIPVSLGAPTASSPYQLVAPSAAPPCTAGLVLPPLGDCYVRLAPPTGTLNQAPQVSAGANQSPVLGQAVQVSGSASDDGLPSVPGVLTTTWSLAAGPLDVAFGNAHALSTPVTFYAPGTYTLRLSAFDGSLTSTSTTQVTVASAAPVMKPIADRTIALGTRFRVALSASDGDVLGTLAFSLPTKPAGAALDPSPIVDWTPTAAQLGQNTFTARVVNAAGQQAQTTFRVNVVSANRPPVLAPQPDATVALGTPFARTLTATDPDSGDALTFELVSGPPGMNLAGANLTWPTTGAAAGDYPVTVRVQDGAGAMDAALFVISVVPASLPLANDDRYSVPVGQSLVVPPSGVLGNDFVPGGTPSANKLSDPAKGTLQAFGADGGFTYQAPSAAALALLDPALDLYLGPADGVRIGVHPPLVADLDGDGKPELIYWHFDELFAVTIATGALLFRANSLPAPYDGCAMYGGGTSRYAVADVDDSGLPSIVVSAQCAADNADYIYHFQSGGNHVVALAHDPSPGNPSHFKVKWLTAPFTPQAPVPPPGDGHLYLPYQGVSSDVSYTIARLAPAEKPTILFGQTYQGACAAVIPGKTDSHCRVVFAVDGATGAVKTSYYAAPAEPASVSAYTAHAPGAYPAPIVADFDGSGAVSIIYEGTWWAANGTVKRQFDGTAATGPATHDSVVADLDGDGTPELIAMDTADRFGIGSIKAWKLDGTLLWQFPIPRDPVISKLTVADIDRDGKPDILFGKRQTLYALGPDGAVKWLRSLPTSGWDFVDPGGENDYPVYDLDGDGVPEVVVQLGKNTLLFLRGTTGETQAVWQYPGTGVENGQSLKTPIVADLAGDGTARVSFYHDVNLNGTNFVVVLKSNNVPWRKAPPHFNQRAYWETNFLVDATRRNSVPATYTRQWLDAATNVFGVQPQAPYAVPPKEKVQATFTYEATGGGATTTPATVTIDVVPPNRPPKFTSRPPWACADEVLFQSYQLTATDPDPGDTLTFTVEFSDLPYFDFNAATGVINFRCGTIYGTKPLATLAIVTDSQGASAYQAFTTIPSMARAPVPNVVGDAQSQAASDLVAAGFVVGGVTEQGATAPQGEVLAQFPSAGASVLLGDRIDLVVSKGPPPAPVPDVVGKSEGAAAAALGAAGFTVDPTHAYSNTVPAGTVMQQTPPAGTIVTPIPANPVALTISAGTGLALRLSTVALQAGGSLPLSTVAIALDGTETPFPGVTYSIAPLTGASGTAPTINAAAFVTSATTRGSYRITATETGGAGRIAQAELQVLPASANANSAYWTRFARVGEAIALYSNAVPAMQRAALANDNAAMLAMIQPIRAKLAQADLKTLRTADPWALESGFAPTLAQVAAAGFARTATDQLFIDTAKELLDRLSNAVAMLDPADPSSSQDLVNELVAIAHLLELMDGLQPTLAGLAGAHPAIAAAVAGLVPQLLDGWLAALADRASKSAKAPPKLSLPTLLLAAGAFAIVATIGVSAHAVLFNHKGNAYKQLTEIAGAVSQAALTATVAFVTPARYREAPTGINAHNFELTDSLPQNYTTIAISSYDEAAATTILGALNGSNGQPIAGNFQQLHDAFSVALTQIYQNDPGNPSRDWENQPSSVAACGEGGTCTGLIFKEGLVAHVPCTSFFASCIEKTLVLVWNQTGGVALTVPPIDMYPQK